MYVRVRRRPLRAAPIGGRRFPARAIPSGVLHQLGAPALVVLWSTCHARLRNPAGVNPMHLLVHLGVRASSQDQERRQGAASGVRRVFGKGKSSDDFVCAKEKLIYRVQIEW